MLQYDEQTLTSYGWAPFAEVFGELPSLEQELQQFVHEQLTQETARRITEVTQNYLDRAMLSMHLHPSGPRPKLEFWNPPGTNSMILVVKTGRK